MFRFLLRISLTLLICKGFEPQIQHLEHDDVIEIAVLTLRSIMVKYIS